jgi:hypothetical protein
VAITNDKYQVDKDLPRAKPYLAEEGRRFLLDLQDIDADNIAVNARSDGVFHDRVEQIPRVLSSRGHLEWLLTRQYFSLDFGMLGYKSAIRIQTLDGSEGSDSRMIDRLRFLTESDAQQAKSCLVRLIYWARSQGDAGSTPSASPKEDRSLTSIPVPINLSLRVPDQGHFACSYIEDVNGTGSVHAETKSDLFLVESHGPAVTWRATNISGWVETDNRGGPFAAPAPHDVYWFEQNGKMSELFRVVPNEVGPDVPQPVVGNLNKWMWTQPLALRGTATLKFHAFKSVTSSYYGEQVAEVEYTDDEPLLQSEASAGSMWNSPSRRFARTEPDLLCIGLTTGIPYSVEQHGALPDGTKLMKRYTLGWTGSSAPSAVLPPTASPVPGTEVSAESALRCLFHIFNASYRIDPGVQGVIKMPPWSTLDGWLPNALGQIGATYRLEGATYHVIRSAPTPIVPVEPPPTPQPLGSPGPVSPTPSTDGNGFAMLPAPGPEMTSFKWIASEAAQDFRASATGRSSSGWHEDRSWTDLYPNELQALLDAFEVQHPGNSVKLWRDGQRAYLEITSARFQTKKRGKRILRPNYIPLMQRLAADIPGWTVSREATQSTSRQSVSTASTVYLSPDRKVKIVLSLLHYDTGYRRLIEVRNGDW